MTPNALYLTKVQYLEEKRRIVLCFSNCRKKKTKGFPFFPSFFLPKGMPLKDIKGVLSNYNPQKFRLKEKPLAFEVEAATFKDLKCMANLCLDAFGERPTMVEPERQFLMLRNWSYFDGFQFFQGKPVKCNSIEFPKTEIEPVSEPLHKTIEQLLSQSNATAKSFLDTIAFSSFLGVPPESVPGKSFQKLELFTENILFKNNFAFLPQKQRPHFTAIPKQPNCPDSVELDFSSIWPLLLTQPFYNIGFESLDCSCCKAQSPFEGNILPTSLADCRFLSEAFFFKSFSNEYAESFHLNAPFPESRVRLKREFFLNYVPIGPFSRNQGEKILLYDALNLCNQGKAELLETLELHWFCQKRESFLSKELRKLNSSIVSLSQSIAAAKKESFQSNGLRATELLSRDHDILFKEAMLNAGREIYCSLPGHLSNQKSHFFDSSICSAINAIQALTLNRFSELLKENKGRLLHVGQGKALVRTENPMSLAKEFSQKARLPLLIQTRKKIPFKAH